MRVNRDQVVYVVEDDLNMQVLLGDFLTSQGYSVKCFSTGQEVLKSLQNEMQSVAAVVTDLVMPGMDGWKVLKEMKASSPHIPLILITAHGTHEIHTQALEMGAAAYLEKPFKLRHLASILRGPATTKK